MPIINCLHKFEIKPGKWIFVPTPESRDIGKEIVERLRSKWKRPRFFFHLKKGGHVLSLKAHQNNNLFIKIDIKSFFASINRSRITRILKNFYPQYEIARNRANWSTVKVPGDTRFVLPYGFVQSPILASICLDYSALGCYLRKVAASPFLTVSVYMDDIIISGSSDDIATKDFLFKVREKIEELLNRSGFEMNLDKSAGPSVKITAFNIDISQSFLAIEENRMNQFIRQVEVCRSEDVYSGVYSYIRSINEAQAEKLQSVFQQRSHAE